MARLGDRYNGYGIVVGTLVWATIGVGAGSTRAWIVGFGFGCAVMNLTSFFLRRVRGSRRRDARKT